MSQQRPRRLQPPRNERLLLVEGALPVALPALGRDDGAREQRGAEEQQGEGQG